MTQQVSAKRVIGSSPSNVFGFRRTMECFYTITEPVNKSFCKCSFTGTVFVDSEGAYDSAYIPTLINFVEYPVKFLYVDYETFSS